MIRDYPELVDETLQKDSFDVFISKLKNILIINVQNLWIK